MKEPTMNFLFNGVNENKLGRIGLTFYKLIYYSFTK